MKTVRDDDGNRYVLLKRSETASLVRDPTTGNECYVGNDRLERVEGVSALETAARAVSEPVRRLLTAVHDEESLGLLLVLADRGPLSVRSILDATDLCESDLSGRFSTWRAAGLIEEATVHGERGYRITEECERGLAALRASRDGGGAEDVDETEDDVGTSTDAGGGPTGNDGEATGDGDEE